jgi:hypothetical protein
MPPSPCPQEHPEPVGTGRIEFSPIGRTRVQVVFDEPKMSSDGGALLLREAVEANGILDAMAAAVQDGRRQQQVEHPLKELLCQRTMQICHGYEDANDCNKLRTDVAFQVAAGHVPDGPPLASQPTVSRLENSVTRRDLIRLFYVFVDHFLASYAKPPESIVIDMDPTPNRVYGDQQLAFFNAHYDAYCLMPFHVYEGLTGRLIATVIRPGKTPTKEEILALLRRIVRRIRKRFPGTFLIFRADSHHTKPEVLDWLEANGVHYVLGLATNSVLQREVQPLLDRAARVHREQWSPCRRFHSFTYAAGSWTRTRRVVARLEATALGTDARFVVTDLEDAGAQVLYERVYCGRGNAELMIKEHKCFLNSSRTSCHTAEANQFRLFLHSAAYVIMHGLRETLLKGTELATATFHTIRLRLLKVAARVESGRTFVRFHLPGCCPAAAVFRRAALIASAVRQT